jgi:hypothetical protein
MNPQYTARRLGAASAAAMLLLLSPQLSAQTVAEDWCRDVRNNQFCEVRQLRGAGTGSLSIDVGANGSIQVEGYTGTEIRVLARVVARGGSESAARDMADDVTVRLDRGSLRAEGPRSRGRNSWTVSVRVQVPEGTHIDARTTNGGITVSATAAPVQARTTNGSIRLNDVAGSLDARSTNGTIRASMTEGTPLQGAQLRTTNGSIHLALPEHTSARVRFSTTNGSIRTDLPVQVQGTVNRRRMEGVMGEGGPEIQATTTNGSIRVTRS